jgi:hypothetical protein
MGKCPLVNKARLASIAAYRLTVISFVKSRKLSIEEIENLKEYGLCGGW